MTAGSIQTDRPFTLFLWALVLAAGAWLRFWQIDIQILLDDEWHAVHRLMQAGYVEIFLSFGHADYSIPLTLLFRGLADSIGLYEWQMRLLPMAFGLAAIVIVPMLLRPWLQSAERLSLGALVAVSPLLIHFSRFVRPYALVVLLGFAAMILLWQWWRYGGRVRTVGFFLCAVTAAWLHPLTTLYTGTALAWFAVAGIQHWRKGEGWRPLRDVLVLGGLTTIACSALILPPLLADTASIAVKAGKDTIELQTLIQSWEMMLGVGSSWIAAVLAVPVAIGARVLWVRDRGFLCFWVVLTLAAGVIIQVLGPEWVHHALVLMRYLAIVVPFVLALLAIGLVQIAVLLIARLRVRYGWLNLTCLVAVAGLYFAGPLPAAYSGVNQFTNSVRYQIDYNFERSVFHSIMTPLETPDFYHEIANEPGQWRLIEAAWYFETNFTPISEYQRSHQLPIHIGMISGLCTDWTWGELQPESELEIELGRFVFLTDVLKAEDDINRFVVFPLSNPFEHDRRSLPDLQPCIDAFSDRFGPPWHENEDFVVFRLPASNPEDAS